MGSYEGFGLETPPVQVSYMGLYKMCRVCEVISTPLSSSSGGHPQILSHSLSTSQRNLNECTNTQIKFIDEVHSSANYPQHSAYFASIIPYAVLYLLRSKLCWRNFLKFHWQLANLSIWHLADFKLEWGSTRVSVVSVGKSWGVVQ